MDLKEKFGITELLTERAYNVRLKPILRNGMAKSSLYDRPGTWSMLEELFDYSDWLHETKLTPELVEKLFEGDIKGLVRFDGFFWMLGLDSKEYQKLITLADLARLTAAKPIPLA